jgi:hypothetical protein
LSQYTGDRAWAYATPAASEILGQAVTYIILTGHCDMRHLMQGDCRRQEIPVTGPQGEIDGIDDLARARHQRVSTVRIARIDGHMRSAVYSKYVNGNRGA